MKHSSEQQILIRWASKLWSLFSSVQWLSRVQLYVTPWITAYQASLSITISWSLLNLMSIKLVMPSNLLILCHPLLPLLEGEEGRMREQRKRESLKSILSGKFNHNDSDSVLVPEWLVFSGCALVCHSSFQKDQTKMQTSYMANLVSLTEVTGCWPTSSVPVFYSSSWLTLFPKLFLQLAIWKFYLMKYDRMLIYFTSKFLREEISFLYSMPSAISCYR